MSFCVVFVDVVLLEEALEGCGAFGLGACAGDVVSVGGVLEGSDGLAPLAGFLVEVLDAGAEFGSLGVFWLRGFV